MKFNQCNTDVTKVTVHYNMPTSQIKCYNVTLLQPNHGLKVRENMYIIISYLSYSKSVLVVTLMLQ